MTREEIMDDIQIGDVIRIRTESGEIFDGKVLDFGSSGLKIVICQNNFSKRIKYERIDEYDIVGDVNISPPEEEDDNSSNGNEKENIHNVIVDTNERVSKDSEIRTGRISFYNKQGGNGLIKDASGETIYFYIKQVKDDELQRILATEYNIKQDVCFTKGINFTGSVAADKIELYEPKNNKEIKSITHSKMGILMHYNNVTQFGRISLGSKIYKFVYNDIQDPFLRADIEFNTAAAQLTLAFNTKLYKGEYVACDIIGIKEYPDEVIENWVNQKVIAQYKVNEWLEKKPYQSIAFKKANYEPLSPIGQLKKNYADDEDNACAILISESKNNPFENLKKISNEKKEYFQEAHSTWLGSVDNVDLDKSEALFIKAIQANDRINSAVANLASIYIKRGNEYVIKGLQMLEIYGYLLSSEKLTHLRIQLIDKSGNFNALEMILKSAIKKCAKRNTVFHYMYKLAVLYSNNKMWKETVDWFEKNIKYLDDNNAIFSKDKYIRWRKGALRHIIIANHYLGESELAIKQAEEFLEDNPKDELIRAIFEGVEDISGFFDSDENDSPDDMFDDFASNDLSIYLIEQLENVDLFDTFSRFIYVRLNIKDGKFDGTLKEALNSESKIKRELKSFNRPESKSAIYLGIARIVSDSKRSEDEMQKATDTLNENVARFAKYKADVLVENFSDIDSTRFLYIHALRYLTSDGYNINSSLNMLIYSFFLDQQDLRNEVVDSEKTRFIDKHFYKECKSMEDFLIATFMLDKSRYVKSILEKVFDNISLKDQFIECCYEMICKRQDINTDLYSEFRNLWANAKDKYYENYNGLCQEISFLAKEYHMGEKIKQRIDKINKLVSGKLLWNKEKTYVKGYCKLIGLIGTIYDKYTVKEKIEVYQEIEKLINKLKSEIKGAPTELGYNFIYPTLNNGLETVIRDEFNKVYEECIPEFSISLSSNIFYFNGKTVKVRISFKNAENKQDANAVFIKLKGEEGADFYKFENTFSSIKGGEELESIAEFSLSEGIIESGQFDMVVGLSYQYYSSVDHINTVNVEEKVSVKINHIIDVNGEYNFKEIDNQYDLICRGNGVDISTPRLFKGRSKIINSICSSMSYSDGSMIKNRGIILWGQRRVGKSSVQNYLKEKIRNTYPDAYIIIELGSIGNCRNLKDILVTIAYKTESTITYGYEEISEELEKIGFEFNSSKVDDPDDYMTEFSKFMSRFKNALGKISKKDCNIPLYFMDEFSYLYEWIEKKELDGKAFMRFWKSFISDYGICSIIVAQDNIPVWKSQYENEFECMNHDNEITYLEFEGSRELICEPCQIGDKPIFTLDAVKAIFNITKGSAYLIVILCKYIIDYLNDNYIEKATRTIVQIVMEKEFLNKKGLFDSGVFEPQIQDVAYITDAEKVNNNNQMLLESIAKGTISSPRVKMDELQVRNIEDLEEIKKTCARLKERKIIEIEEGVYCSINMPLLKMFLLREQGLLTKELMNDLFR